MFQKFVDMIFQMTNAVTSFFMCEYILKHICKFSFKFSISSIFKDW